MTRPDRAGLASLALTLLLWHVAAMAADWNLSTLMSQLASRSSGRASFSETKYFAVLDSPIEQTGTLAFAPGRLEKITRQPYQERLIVNGDALSIETGAGGGKRILSLQRYPPVWGFVEGIRATLTGDLDTLRRFYEIELHGTSDDWELVMIPLPPEMAAVLRMVSIRGSEGRIAIIEVVQKGGDRSVMRITEGVP